MSVILDLLTHPLADEFAATKYLKAGGEILVLCVIIGWTLTYFYNPDSIDDNALKRRMGYNNVCVGFDTLPARYVTQFLWPLSIYCNIRFAWLEVVTEVSLDEDNTSRTGKLITIFASGLFVLSVLGQTFLFVFPPAEGPPVWIHTGWFVQYIFVRVFVIAVLFFRNTCDKTTEDFDSITTASWIWFFCFTASSILLPLLTLADFYWYDYVKLPGEEGPLIPWYFVFATDMGWFATLATTAKFLPAERTYRASQISKHAAAQHA